MGARFLLGVPFWPNFATETWRPRGAPRRAGGARRPRGRRAPGAPRPVRPSPGPEQQQRAPRRPGGAPQPPSARGPGRCARGAGGGARGGAPADQPGLLTSAPASVRPSDRARFAAGIAGLGRLPRARVAPRPFGGPERAGALGPGTGAAPAGGGGSCGGRAGAGAPSIRAWGAIILKNKGGRGRLGAPRTRP